MRSSGSPSMAPPRTGPPRMRRWARWRSWCPAPRAADSRGRDTAGSGRGSTSWWSERGGSRRQPQRKPVPRRQDEAGDRPARSALPGEQEADPNDGQQREGRAKPGSTSSLTRWTPRSPRAAMRPGDDQRLSGQRTEHHAPPLQWVVGRRGQQQHQTQAPQHQRHGSVTACCLAVTAPVPVRHTAPTRSRTVRSVGRVCNQRCC